MTGPIDLNSEDGARKLFLFVMEEAIKQGKINLRNVPRNEAGLRVLVRRMQNAFNASIPVPSPARLWSLSETRRQAEYIEDVKACNARMDFIVHGSKDDPNIDTKDGLTTLRGIGNYINDGRYDDAIDALLINTTIFNQLVNLSKATQERYNTVASIGEGAKDFGKRLDTYRLKIRGGRIAKMESMLRELGLAAKIGGAFRDDTAPQEILFSITPFTAKNIQDLLKESPITQEERAALGNIVFALRQGEHTLLESKACREERGASKGKEAGTAHMMPLSERIADLCTLLGTNVGFKIFLGRAMRRYATAVTSDNEDDVRNIYAEVVEIIADAVEPYVGEARIEDMRALLAANREFKKTLGLTMVSCAKQPQSQEAYAEVVQLIARAVAPHVGRGREDRGGDTFPGH